MSWHRLRVLVASQATCTHVSYSPPFFLHSILSFTSSSLSHSCYYYQHSLRSHSWIESENIWIILAKMNLNTSSNLETRSLLDELCSFDKKGLFDLGHPLLNRILESFVKAAGVFLTIPFSFSLTFLCTNIFFFFFQIGAVQAVSREAFFSAIEGATDTPPLSVVVVNYLCYVMEMIRRTEYILIQDLYCLCKLFFI